jgi:hypothetical protein
MIRNEQLWSFNKFNEPFLSRQVIIVSRHKIKLSHKKVADSMINKCNMLTTDNWTSIY